MTSPDGTYHDVAARLREQITSGELPPGAPVPSVRALARDYGTTEGRARQALDKLTNEGLITSGTGKTRFVRDRTILYHYASQAESKRRRVGAPADAWMTDVKEQGMQPGYLWPSHRVEMVEATDDIARLLNLSPGDLVVVRRRIRTVNGRPDNINDTYYDHTIALQFPEILSPHDVPTGVVALMASRGYVQVGYRHELRWRPPTPEEAAALELPPGVAVLVQMHAGYTDEDKRHPVKVTVTTWPGDSHVLIYEVEA
jgi:GntR family transcriptional regulator